MTPDTHGHLSQDIINALPSLNARARSLCRTRWDAQDLVQETIVRGLRNWDRFEPGTNLRAWLLRIMFNLFVTKRRRANRERVNVAQLAAANDHQPCSDAASIGTCILSPRLAEALDTLPEKIALVVRKVDVDELSYREVAEEMRIPIGTVMSRLSRGRKRLAQAVSDDNLQLRAEAA